MNTTSGENVLDFKGAQNGGMRLELYSTSLYLKYNVKLVHVCLELFVIILQKSDYQYFSKFAKQNMFVSFLSNYNFVQGERCRLS